MKRRGERRGEMRRPSEVKVVGASFVISISFIFMINILDVPSGYFEFINVQIKRCSKFVLLPYSTWWLILTSKIVNWNDYPVLHSYRFKPYNSYEKVFRIFTITLLYIMIILNFKNRMKRRSKFLLSPYSTYNYLKI